MRTTIDEHEPEKGTYGQPIWHHHHATKMSVVAMSLCDDLLVIQGSAAELIISRHRNNWLVAWRVIQSRLEQTKGQTIFSDNDLERAFGLRNDMEEAGNLWLISKYGGTTAHQFKFIRYKDYLNIPCPGTGHDGDPNISIRVDERMKDAVKELIYKCR